MSDSIKIEIIRQFCTVEQLKHEQVALIGLFQKIDLLSWITNWRVLTLRKCLDSGEGSSDLGIGLSTALSYCFVIGSILNVPIHLQADILGVCSVWCGVANPCVPTFKFNVELEAFELGDKTINLVNKKFNEKLLNELNLKAIDISLSIPPQISSEAMEELVDSFLQAAVVYYTAKRLMFLRIERAED